MEDEIRVTVIATGLNEKTGATGASSSAAAAAGGDKKSAFDRMMEQPPEPSSEDDSFNDILKIFSGER